MKTFLKVALLTLVIIALSFLQAMGFSLWGVKPNLALVSVITISFFISSLVVQFFMLAFPFSILKDSPVVPKELWIFLFIGAGAILLKKYLPGKPPFNIIFILFIATTAFYALTFPQLIISWIFLKELILNLILGGIIFILFSFSGKIIRVKLD